MAVGAVRASGGGRTLTVGAAQRVLRSAVYDVRWSVLGDDGHIVTGSFDFGVAGAKGAAPPGSRRCRAAAAAAAARTPPRTAS